MNGMQMIDKEKSKRKSMEQKQQQQQQQQQHAQQQKTNKNNDAGSSSRLFCEQLFERFIQHIKNKDSIYYTKNIEKWLLLQFVKKQSESKVVFQVEFDASIKLFSNEAIRQILDDYWIQNRPLTTYQKEEWKCYLCWQDIFPEESLSSSKFKVVYQVIWRNESIKAKKEAEFMKICSVFKTPIEELAELISKEKMRCSQTFKQKNKERNFLVNKALFEEEKLSKKSEEERALITNALQFYKIAADAGIALVVHVEVDSTWLYRIRAKCFIKSETDPTLEQQLSFHPVYLRTCNTLHFIHSKFMARSIFWHMIQSSNKDE
jgi:hypothetical protein